MELKLRLNEGDLDHTLMEQIMIHVLRDDYNSADPSTCWHEDDKKQNRKLRKAIKRILNYYGAGVIAP